MRVIRKAQLHWWRTQRRGDGGCVYPFDFTHPFLFETEELQIIPRFCKGIGIDCYDRWEDYLAKVEVRDSMKGQFVFVVNFFCGDELLLMKWLRFV